MSNKVSVIIPTYNRIKFLLSAIESVIKQTYPIHQIIVVDNNSTDKSIDAAISELDFSKRKVSLSIKLLEELSNAKAIKEHSSPLSGKNLPFSSLSDKLEKKEKK